ncbi:hypothetical protein FRC06_011261 [Ceratobasidium sp. 370]|nr:hypothetical protein FRC06_011261 [Ceratobasidium sp. 370]
MNPLTRVSFRALAFNRSRFTVLDSYFKLKAANFRRVLWTGENSQLVIMTIPVGGEIGEEVHTHLIFTSGTAKAIVAGEEKKILAGDLVIVPAGTKLYAPAEHATTSKHKTLEEGEKLEEAGKDEPPSWAQKSDN